MTGGGGISSPPTDRTRRPRAAAEPCGTGAAECIRCRSPGRPPLPCHAKREPPLREVPEAQSVRQTRLLDALHQEALAEGIQDHQREDNHQAAGVADSRVVQILPRVIHSQRRRNGTHQFDQHVGVGCDKEQVGVEIVGPLPAEGEQEHGNQHGDRKRENDAVKGAHRARAIDVRRLLQLIRNAPEELPQQEDIQAVFEGQTAQRQHHQWEIGVDEVDTVLAHIHLQPPGLPRYAADNLLVLEELDFVRQDVQTLKEACRCGKYVLDVVAEQLDSAALEQTHNAEDVKVAELHEHGELQRLVRHNHGQQHEHEQNAAAAELEFGKAVADQRADEGLQNAANQRERKGVAQSRPVVQLLDDRAVNVQREVLRNQADGYVHKVIRAHHRTGDFADEGKQHDVGNTNHQHQAENPPHHLAKEVNRKIFCLEPFLQRGPFKIHPDFVFGFSADHRLFRGLLCIHFSFTSFQSDLR